MLGRPEPHQGGQPAAAHGLGRAGLAAAPLRSADNTIVGAGPQGRLTRIAGRDVSKPDGHTVGKTFSRKELRGSPWSPAPARSAASASNPLPAPAQDRYRRVDPSTPRVHKIAGLQNGARETGLGHWLPGFLRSNVPSKLNFHRLIMPREN